VKIKFVQRGGFAGIDLVSELDTNSLSSREVQIFNSLLENSRFFDLPSWCPPPKKGADYLEYKIVIESEGRIHTVNTTDIAMPSELARLVTFLRRKCLDIRTRGKSSNGI
jgi:hypothetical protein